MNNKDPLLQLVQAVFPDAKIEPDEFDSVFLTKHVEEVTTVEFVTNLRIK